MRDSHYLPWEKYMECGNGSTQLLYKDDDGRACVGYLAGKVSERTHYTTDEVEEKIYRLIGWMCK